LFPAFLFERSQEVGRGKEEERGGMRMDGLKVGERQGRRGQRELNRRDGGEGRTKVGER
jgi:hypothetical protein